MKAAAAYAAAQRSLAPKVAHGPPVPAAPFLPRNAKSAIPHARERQAVLVVSFVGDTQWHTPTIYADADRQYDWGCIAGLRNVAIATKPGLRIGRHAQAIMVETFMGPGMTYPLLLDAEQRECAYVCPTGRGGIQLWPLRRHSDEWQSYFGTAE